MIRDFFKDCFFSFFGIVSTLLIFLTGCSSDLNLCKTRKENIKIDKCKILEYTVTPTRPLTYKDVVTLALCRNVDLLTRQWEYEIQRETVTGEKLGMLPTLTFRGNDETRSSVLAQSSVDYATGSVTVPPSVSTERPSRTWNAQAVWSLLDFGLSYYKSRIALKKLEIIHQQQEKLKQNLILEVTKAYWKAVVSQEGMEKSSELVAKIKARIDSLEKEQNERLISQIEGLDLEKRLTEMQLRLYSFEYDFISAKIELSALIGFKVGPCFELERPGFNYSESCFCIERLEEIALLSRPELLAGDVDERMQADEVRASVINLFPNAQLFGGPNYDHNPFLIYHYWWNVGYRATFDLLSLPRGLTALQIAKGKKKASQFTRLALSIGVMSQVRLAYIEYLQGKKHYQLTRQLSKINERLLIAAYKERDAGEYKFDDVLKLEVDAFLSYVGMLAAFGEMQISLEKIDNAMGIPLFLWNNCKYRLKGQLDPHSFAKFLCESVNQKINRYVQKRSFDPKSFNFNGFREGCQAFIALK